MHLFSCFGLIGYMRRMQNKSLALTLSISLVASASSCESDKPKSDIGRAAPNVFVLVIDAASAQYFGCYGDAQGASPVIDEFAAQNVLFENAYSQTATTVSSTASLLTGTRATTHSMNANTTLAEDLKTGPQLLREIGCRCFGIIGNPWAGVSSTGLDRGYETCIQVWAQPELAGNRPIESTSKFIVTMPEDINGATDAVLDKFTGSGGFAYVHYLQPHKPYDPPEKYLRDYPCGSLAWGDLEDLWAQANRTGEAAKATIEQLEARYRANIRYLDQAVGEFFNKLKKAGLYDDALIVLTSDHGDAFFKHRQFGHNVHLYDDMVRVPLIIKFPAREKMRPRRIGNLVETIDLMPTIFEYIGAERPAQFEGDSLLPLITGERTRLAGREVITCTVNGNRHAIRVEDYKYIYTRKSKTEELFDLRSDPDEQRNLIGTADGRKKADALRQWLERIVDLSTGKAVTRGHAMQSDEEMKKLLDSLGYIDGQISDEEAFNVATSQPASQPATQPASGTPADKAGD